MHLGPRGVRHRAVPVALVISAWMLFGTLTPASAAADPARAPNLKTGSAYLVAPANLIAGHYYESFAGVADFGLTIDGALALAATGDEDQALRTVVTFIDDDGRDPSGNTVNDWTGIGTPDVSGGAIGKEALLAEVVGDNPRSFGGHNLIAALDASVCTRSAGAACPAPGSYRNDTSVFDQALGIMAQLRAAQNGDAAAPIAYLESLQAANGSFPSLIPASGGPDVDSTAMAAMALALCPGRRAAAAVVHGLTWIASKQERNGGFPSAGAESVNSTGLAIQALTLRAADYKPRITAALAFLASEQNRNGGFNADAGGQRGSNVRASTQAVGGAVGTSFGTLHRDLSGRVADARRGGGRAGEHKTGGRANADAGGQHHLLSSRNRPRLHASAQPAVGADRASSGTPRPGPVADAGHSSDLAIDLWLASAGIAVGVIALILGGLHSRAQRRAGS
jgi:hypothetical protein